MTAKRPQDAVEVERLLGKLRSSGFSDRAILGQLTKTMPVKKTIRELHKIADRRGVELNPCAPCLLLGLNPSRQRAIGKHYPPKDPDAGDPQQTHLTVGEFLTGWAVFRLWNDEARAQITTTGPPARSKRGANANARRIAAVTGETIRNPSGTRRKIPEMHGDEFAGMHVAVAFNLHKAKKDPEQGEYIFTVREKAGGKVLAHVSEIALKDVTPKVLAGTLRAIKKKKVRGVCCYLVGTVVPASKVPKTGRKKIHFNPYRADCFTIGKTGPCLDSARYVLMTEGRTTVGVGAVPERNPRPRGCEPRFQLPPKKRKNPKKNPSLNRLVARALR